MKLYTAKLLLLLLFACSAGAQKHALSVQEAADYARKNSAQVKNALLGIQIQRQTNREITAAAYPQVNGNIAAGYNPNVAVQQFPNFIAAATYGVLQAEGVKDGSGRTIVAPADFGFIQAQFGSKFNASYGLTFQQLLFEGQVFVGLQARRTSIEFQTKSAEVTEENIKANIHKIYFQLVASRAQLQMLDANIERFRKLERDTRVLYENGFAERLEISRATVQLSNMETERTKALNNIANGYLGLKMLMGMPVSDTLVLTDTISYETIRDGILESTVYNYSNRKEYQMAELGKKLNEYNIKRYQLSYFPTVALSGNYSRISQSNKFDFFGESKWFPASSIGLNIAVPIFDGFAREARIKRAQLQLQQTNNDIEALKINIDREVQQALNNYRSALATLDAQRRNIELAEQVYNQTRLKREEGMGSTLEITSAQSDLQIAQSNYILALYDAINARIDFLRATGTLQ